jgi:Lipid A 3-O-deacylase (PagL)
MHSFAFVNSCMIPAMKPGTFSNHRVIAALFVFLFMCGVCACAQTKPEDGGHEIEVWTGGGPSVAGGRTDTSVWNVGLRYGWIITSPHGPGFLSGRFEYAVDAVPAFMVFQPANTQPANTAYGVGIVPLNLKWVLATRNSIAPYFELSGGVLFTNHDVPTGTNTVNFFPSAAVGVHFLRDTYNLSIEARYLHISNAGLTAPNPGINTVEVRVGIGRFLHAK